MAQGGIAAALRAGDSVESHIKDTLETGAGLCNPETVSYVVENGPAAIDFLIAHGVKFTEVSETECFSRGPNGIIKWLKLGNGHM